METVKEKIKSHLEKNKIKHKYLSDKLAISPTTLSQIFNTKRKLKLDEYIAITKALGVPFDYFINKIKEKHTNE